MRTDCSITLPARAQREADDPAHAVAPLGLARPRSVRLPSAFSVIALWTGMKVVARWWWSTFHSTPPEIQAPSIPMRAGLMTCWR